MLLAIDIGNTNIVAGVFAGDTLATTWRVATDDRRTPDEYGVLLESFFQARRLDIAEVRGVILCSVVPAVLSALCEAVRQYIGIEPMVLSPQLEVGIEVHYTPRSGVGADRIANAVAAIHRYGVPAVVVDFGTGTNFDVISPDGIYIGGAIAPGLEIAEQALYSHAAQLTRVPLAAPPTAIGTNTVAAVQSGLLYGYAGLVDGLVDRICRELGDGARIIATGGLAGVVAPLTRTVEHVDPDLTLIGLQIIYMQNTANVGRTGPREN